VYLRVSGPDLFVGGHDGVVAVLPLDVGIILPLPIYMKPAESAGAGIDGGGRIHTATLRTPDHPRQMLVVQVLGLYSSL
jgi:hypothetical protein